MEKFSQKQVFTKDPHEKSIAEKLLKSSWGKGEKTLACEYWKSLEVKKSISHVISLCDNYYKKLGFEIPQITENRVHLFTEKDYKKIWKEKGEDCGAEEGLGSYNPDEGSVYVNLNSSYLNDEKGFNYSFFEWVIAHEITHLSSKQKFDKKIPHLAKSMEKYMETKNALDSTRVGFQNYTGSNYRVNNGRKYLVSGHTHFRGFNEAVVEEITLDIFSHSEKEFEEKRKHYNESGYSAYLEILRLVVGELSRYKKTKSISELENIEKSQFTGDMMFLRDIEKCFGPGSVRIIAAMGTNLINKEKIENEQQESFAIQDFLHAKDIEKRDRIARNLLIKKEYLQYKKHLQINT